ncbi:glutamate receptor 1-like protein, partial [Dinothrombium tinctorium]
GRIMYEPNRSIVICAIFQLFLQVIAIPDRIPIGAIFPPNSEEIEAAFRYALRMHNANESQSRFKLEPKITSVDSDDPFQVTRQLCLQLSQGIFTLVAPLMGPSYETIVSYSNTFAMPFIHPGFSQTSNIRPANYSISMKPRYLPAIIDVIKFYEWKGIIYLYDSDDGKNSLSCVAQGSWALREANMCMEGTSRHGLYS